MRHTKLFFLPKFLRSGRHSFGCSLLVLAALTCNAGADSKSVSSKPSASVGEKSARTGGDIQRAVDAVYPALVRIHVVYEEGSGGRMEKNRASGSGAIISEEGYIITNHHVAGRATRIVCRLSNREEVDAELVGTDPLSDLAILKLDLSSRRDPTAKLTAARFGDSDALAVGDVVLAMGSPSGLSQSVTRGIVANTAMILPGSSSDFLLDGENELAGIRRAHPRLYLLVETEEHVSHSYFESRATDFSLHGFRTGGKGGRAE